MFEAKHFSIKNKVYEAISECCDRNIILITVIKKKVLFLSDFETFQNKSVHNKTKRFLKTNKYIPIIIIGDTYCNNYILTRFK